MKLVYQTTVRFFALERGDRIGCQCHEDKRRCQEPAGMLVIDGECRTAFCWSHYEALRNADWPEYRDLRGEG